MGVGVVMKPLAGVRPQWSEGYKCLQGEDAFCRRLPGRWFEKKGLMGGLVSQSMKGLKKV